MYNRDGVRQSWYDPVGGLKSVAANEMLEYLAQSKRFCAKQDELRSHWGRYRLQGLGTRAAAMENLPHLYRLFRKTNNRSELAEETDQGETCGQPGIE